MDRARGTLDGSRASPICRTLLRPGDCVVVEREPGDSGALLGASRAGRPAGGAAVPRRPSRRQRWRCARAAGPPLPRGRARCRSAARGCTRRRRRPTTACASCVERAAGPSRELLDRARPAAAAAVHRATRRAQARGSRALPDRLRADAGLGGRAHRRAALHPRAARAARAPAASRSTRSRCTSAPARSGPSDARGSRTTALPPERVEISAATAAAVNRARERRAGAWSPSAPPRRGRSRARPARTAGWRPLDGPRRPLHPPRRSASAWSTRSLTNFHLPRSTLLVLVAAFAGRELILRAYRHAVAARLSLLLLRRRDADHSERRSASSSSPPTARRARGRLTHRPTAWSRRRPSCRWRRRARSRA